MAKAEANCEVSERTENEIIVTRSVGRDFWAACSTESKGGRGEVDECESKFFFLRVPLKPKGA